MRTAGPPEAIVWLPAESGLYGKSVSPIDTVTWSTGRVRTSAAICASAVLAPVPMSWVPIRTWAVPSGLSRSSA